MATRFGEAVPARWRELWRYYQAGAVNTLFGYSLYALLVAAGLNLFAAQIVSHVTGAAFNYWTFSRHTFRDRQGSKTRFVLAYAGQYLLSLACFALLAPLIRSPYLIGLVTIGIVSLLNYFVLKQLVFRRA
ncbi:GtrA family protein [Sphingomonas ginkgonis]|uniref:GtrA family protein n=1 Tax=Sphingomonas ginkgonis TaxID=2315330 RepID=A0A429V901_9SPHN|nr:GtrA family protein [Sphingomonas ginkgonis]RST30362.1 GtrA family protein [Sphingomonas ginkgonis]